MTKVLNDIDHHHLPGLLAQVVPSHASDFHLWGSSPSINTYPAKKKNDIDHLSLYRFILSRTSIDYISDLKKSEDARWRMEDLALRKLLCKL